MYIFTKQNPIFVALAATIVTAMISSMFYLLFEPGSILAATDTDEFTVQQDIGAEISFATNATDVVMDGTIGGTTGGTTNGSTTVAITTNNSAGYYMTIQFADAEGMLKSDGSDRISYYATTSPDYTMTLGGTATTAMAYSVSSTAAVQNFLNNGSACNQSGGASNYKNCFMVQGTPDSSPETLVNSATSVTAQQTIVSFRVIVAGNSGLTNGSYYATTTLTAITN